MTNRKPPFRPPEDRRPPPDPRLLGEPLRNPFHRVFENRLARLTEVERRMYEGFMADYAYFGGYDEALADGIDLSFAHVRIGSHPGRREANQDKGLVDPVLGISAVADGRGEHGQLASGETIRALRRFVSLGNLSVEPEMRAQRLTDTTESRFAAIGSLINRAVHEELQTASAEVTSGASLAGTWIDGHTLYSFHQGNSYNVVMREGRIVFCTRSLGEENQRFAVERFELQPGDMVLNMTQGVAEAVGLRTQPTGPRAGGYSLSQAEYEQLNRQEGLYLRGFTHQDAGGFSEALSEFLEAEPQDNATFVLIQHEPQQAQLERVKDRFARPTVLPSVLPPPVPPEAPARPEPARVQVRTERRSAPKIVTVLEEEGPTSVAEILELERKRHEVRTLREDIASSAQLVDVLRRAGRDQEADFILWDIWEKQRRLAVLEPSAVKISTPTPEDRRKVYRNFLLESVEGGRKMRQAKEAEYGNHVSGREWIEAYERLYEVHWLDVMNERLSTIRLAWADGRFEDLVDQEIELREKGKTERARVARVFPADDAHNPHMVVVQFLDDSGKPTRQRALTRQQWQLRAEQGLEVLINEDLYPVQLGDLVDRAQRYLEGTRGWFSGTRIAEKLRTNFFPENLAAEHRVVARALERPVVPDAEHARELLSVASEVAEALNRIDQLKGSK